MKTAEHIGYLLILLACLAGVVWFVISTIADAGRKLTGCKHERFFVVQQERGQVYAQCHDCDKVMVGIDVSMPIPDQLSKDPTIPEDEPAKLRVIRGGKGGN